MEIRDSVGNPKQDAANRTDDVKTLQKARRKNSPDGTTYVALRTRWFLRA